jgi:uncharacterized protein
MTEPPDAAAPLSPDVHLLDSGTGRHLFLPDGSRLYDVDAATFDQLDRLRRGDGHGLRGLLDQLGVDATPYVDDSVLVDPPVRALSLAVAQNATWVARAATRTAAASAARTPACRWPRR